MICYTPEGVNQCLVVIECHEHSSKTFMEEGMLIYYSNTINVMDWSHVSKQDL